jgi:hypothetical protein
MVNSETNQSETPLKLEVEMKRDGSVKMVFPSLDDSTLLNLFQSLPQLQGDIAGSTDSDELRRRVPQLFETRSRQLEERVERIEGKISNLVTITEEISNSLRPASSRNRDDVRIPSNGTKYNEVLRRLTLEYGSAPFESTCVAENERHILSILNNRYNALAVTDNRGRTNIYRVRDEIIHKVFSNEGECINVEIRGKTRDMVERVLKSNKENYPKFSYFYKEGADQRHLYTLIFGDPTVKVSVMENLSRSVGNHRNMKIYSS